MKYFWILLFICGWAHAQIGEVVHGRVHALTNEMGIRDSIPLSGANVYWLDTTLGTVTDTAGMFSLQRPGNGEHHLIVNYVGYIDDTLLVEVPVDEVNIVLHELARGKGITIHGRQPALIRANSAAVNSQTITEHGLGQMACCSMAESFENTVSVDVEQSDAISGARRIKMLGLAGYYTQIMSEKMPFMRGLVSPYALEYVPGFWLEEVNISKGTASVATGYEAITGQINAELKKPQTTPQLAANAYLNSMAKADLAILARQRLNPRLSTMLLTFATRLEQRWDNNNDTFLDMPLLQQFTVMNRWYYEGDDLDAQLGLRFIHDDRRGGQFDFDFDNPDANGDLYGSQNDIRRYEIFAKTGFYIDQQGSSVGLIISAAKHDIATYAGEKTYSGDEASFYTSLSLNKLIGNHTVAAGLSYHFDDRSEIYNDEVFSNDEQIPGIYTEYTYQALESITAMAGLRYDRHNRFGDLLTPRLHLNYRPDGATSIRFSAGRGYRTPYIFADNPAIIASSKELIIDHQLNVEEAWNTGLELTRDFSFNENVTGTLALDYYHTSFTRQVVVDMDASGEEINLYNLSGRSFANSAQAELHLNIYDDFAVTAAWRYNDVRITYRSGLATLPLNHLYKGMLSLSYTTTDENWQFDYTAQFNGRTRLPNTSDNPAEYQLDEYSSQFTLMYFQAKYIFSDWEVYAGIENLTDYRQKNPILAWQEPFSSYFDSSLIWGPTFGRRFYVGFRFDPEIL
jgi:outer membrane receptor for ferrienterochelin and colicins